MAQVPLSPMSARWGVVGAFGVAALAVVLGIVVLPWLHVSIDEFGGHSHVDISLRDIAAAQGYGDIVGVAMTITAYTMVIGMLFFAWRLVEALRAIVRGYPRTKLGSFGDQLVRGWSTPWRARVHVWSLLAFPLLVCAVTPNESVQMADISVDVHLSWGAYVIFGAIAIAAAAIEWIARVPGLAATQWWNDLQAVVPASDGGVIELTPPPVSRNASRRPMLANVPLPPPPVIAGADPFRGGSSPVDLESKLVRHDTAPVVVPRAAAADGDGADADAHQPSLLR